mmetsp:Transcript_101783/g.287073  ORF Transcript_101783/g.287073 Transcript_101783/m.287073 type:complete len:246 (-) Transcript_101783:225-962(-)
MPKISIHLVRHGQSVANTLNLLGRTPESTLSALGEAQARLLGATHGPAIREALQDGMVFASTAKRAQQTATFALEQAQVLETDAMRQMLLRDSITEIFRGDWDGKANEGDVKRRLHELDAQDPLHWKSPGEGAESRHDVQLRTARFLDEATAYLQEMCADGKDVNAYVFCHSVVIECLLCHVLGCDMAHRFGPANTSISTIEKSGCPGVWKVKRINNMEHMHCDPKTAATDSDGGACGAKRRRED